MKKKYILILLIAIAVSIPNFLIAQCENVTIESLTNPGPFTIATLTEADGLRDGPDYNGATVYYPTNGMPPFASIAIVPGFNSFPSSVAEWGPFYASHGIVAIIIGTNSIVDFPEARAAALLDAIETIKQENVRSDSPLLGTLDTDKIAVSGWSMGGGGAQRAAVLDPTIKAVVAMCPFLFDAEVNHDTPVLIFSGENDTVAPPASQANVHYANTPETTDKLLFEVENGNHSVANTPNGGNGITGRLALSWIKLYVEENACYCPLFSESLLNDPPAASTFSTNIGCAILSVEQHSIDNISAFPNPTNDYINLNIENTIDFQLYSVFGQQIMHGKLNESNKKIDLSHLPESIYYLRIGNNTIKVLKAK